MFGSDKNIKPSRTDLETTFKKLAAVYIKLSLFGTTTSRETVKNFKTPKNLLLSI